ncbi:PREDICTED: uncharacterized protein LOC109220328 [Nicotiana attenuata]|uniref:uncharacterized protein LOC109220328 n=1 Tax=Nicotiana attenuata TaxID=49451 RepID=UPI00090561BB|nr:PREDICTED: uncharacterized protein LOC109220328 [Nicotiana attenuata]
MIVSSWNIRGLNKPFKQIELKAFLFEHKIALLGCLETKIKPRSVTKVKEKFNREWKVYSDEAINERRRIWILWKEQLVQVNITLASDQLVHCKVRDKSTHNTFEITFVYGKNTVTERRNLWDQLRKIRSNIQEAWLLIGDFNSMLFVDDRINGQPVQQAELVDVQRCVDDIGVGQLNRKGSKWSWCNKRDVNDRIYSNIDWAFGNAAWLTKYSSVEAIFETPGVSDHSPIVINAMVVKSYMPKPFRLYNVLLHNKEFEQAVEEAWGQHIEGYKMYSVWMKLRRLKDKVLKLNKEMSSLEKKLDSLRQQLKITQEKLDKDPLNDVLITEERKLISQKIKWEEVNEKELVRPTTYQDIELAVKELPNDKALGVDGFPVDFFKIYWKLVGSEVKQAIKDFFDNGKLLKSINCTTVTLVPKVNGPTYVKEFRPIACCSIVYKIIAKILTVKLKTVVDYIVGADKISIRLLMSRFQHFSEVSGLKANMEKSALYIPGVSKEFKEEMMTEMKFGAGKVPFKYLGVPLSAKKLSIQQCMPLVEKITARLKCWSTKFLSYSGRIFLLPTKISKLIVNACRTFLWTGNIETSRRALVAWDKVCMPYSAGGLNIIDIVNLNKAALCKLLWAINEQKDNL